MIQQLQEIFVIDGAKMLRTSHLMVRHMKNARKRDVTWIVQLSAVCRSYWEIADESTFANVQIISILATNTKMILESGFFAYNVSRLELSYCPDLIHFIS